MFEREDWTLFRTIEGLQQKAGVPAAKLRRLVLKELGDNALDTGTAVKFGQIDDGRFFVEDAGPGLDGTPSQIAELFSVRRPMRSTKSLRLPQRGALGNGLRVIAGAVLASEGLLTVITRNRRIELRPPRSSTSASNRGRRSKTASESRTFLRKISARPSPLMCSNARTANIGRSGSRLTALN
jgi:hypothetical protein